MQHPGDRRSERFGIRASHAVCHHRRVRLRLMCYPVPRRRALGPSPPPRGVLAAIACAATQLGTAGIAPSAAATAPLSAPAGHGCLPGGNGYLRARIRGAVNLDLDWHNAQLECDGGPRPDGSGFRLSFAGAAQGHHLRIVLGIRSAVDALSGHTLPTNLTVIFEGEQRVFATRGDDKCTLDRMRQQRISGAQDAAAAYRVTGRGFCIDPASALSGRERILVSRFDFAGRRAIDEPAPSLHPGEAQARR
jgi:hypothetical protein